MSGMTIRIDANEFPLLVIRVSVSPTETDIDDAYNALLPLTRRGRVATVVDLTMIDPDLVTPRLRAYLYERLTALLAQTQLVAEALVFTSEMIALFYKAYTWMMPPKSPRQEFSDVSSAKAWCRQRLEADSASRE